MTSLFFDIFGRDNGATQAFNDVGRAADNAGTRLAALNTQMQAAARAEQEATAAMESAAQRETTARAQAEQAATRLRTAEQQLDQVRRSIAPTAENIAAAEQRVSQARRDAAAAEQELSSAEQDTVAAAERLTTAHNNASNAARQHSSALKETENSMRSLGTETDNVITKFRNANLGSTMFAAIGASIQPLLASIGQLSGALGLLPAAAVAVGTAFGTAVVGVQGMGTALKAAETASKASAAAAQADAQVHQGVAGAVQTAAAAHRTAAQAADAYAASLKGLAPSAQQVVSAIVQLKPAFDGLRLDVQQHLFAGIAQELQNLGSSVLPVVRTGMTQMADALNNAIKQVADFAKQKSSIEDYKQIFASVAQAAKSFGDAIKPILQIFTDVAAVGAPLLAQLADHFKTAAQHAAEFVSQARQSGQLKQWIQQGIDAVKELWGAFKDVVAIIKDLATAQGFGPNFLQALHDVTSAIRWIIENVPGATTIIQAFFDAWLVAKVIQGLANMVKSITDVIGMLKKFVTANEEAAAASEAAAGRASTAWATVGKAIGLAGLALGADALLPQNTPEQTKQGQEHPVTGFFDSQRDELHGMADAIKDPMKALEDLKQELAAFPGQAASSPIVQFFSQLPTQIATEIGKVREALTRNASNMWQGFTQALNTGWASVTSFFSGIGAKITAAVGNATQWLAQKARDVWTGFTTALNTAWTTVTTWFSQLGTKISTAVGNATQWLAQKARDVWTGFTTALNTAWNTVATWFQGVAQKVQTAVGNATQWLAQKAKDVWTGFTTALNTAWTAVATWFQGVAQKVQTAVGDATQWLAQKAQDLWNGFVQALNTAWNTVAQWFQQLGQKIVQAVGDLSQTLVQAAQQVMQGFYQAMVDFYNNTIAPWLQSIAQSITSLKGPADKDYHILQDAGTQIMAGFHDAMQSRWGSIATWLGSLGGLIQRAAGSVDMGSAIGGDDMASSSSHSYGDRHHHHGGWRDWWRRNQPLPQQLLQTAGGPDVASFGIGSSIGLSGTAVPIMPSVLSTYYNPGTRSIANPGGPGGSGNHVYINTNSALIQELLRMIRAEVRKQGGDVQAVLGY